MSAAGNDIEERDTAQSNIAEPASAAESGAKPQLPTTRREIIRWLLTRTRDVLAPLGASILMRIVGLTAGATIVGYGAFSAARALTGEVSLSRVVMILVGLSLLKALARYLEHFFGHLVAFRALATLRVYFFDRLEPQAPAATEGRRTGDLLSRATRDIDRIEVFFAHTLGPAITAVIVPIGLTAWIAAVASPWLAVTAACGWLLIGAVIPMIGNKRALASARRLREERGEIAQHFTDSVQGAREIVSFGYEQRRRVEQDDLGAEMHADLARLGHIVALRRGLIAFVGAGLVSGLVLVGSHEIGGAYGWEILAFVGGLVLGGMPAVLAVEEFSADLDQAFASAARVAEITEAAPATPQSARPQRPAEPRLGAVQIDAVSFTYPGGTEPVLTDISLDLPAGSTTAIVGASGSGKSTLASLLVRFYDPDDGAVRIDGVDVRDLADVDLRGLITIVGQRPYLLNATIAENLRVAAPDASDDDLVAACQVAALDLEEFDDGLDTPVGEQGASVSGGQRQRIAIARALLRDAPILVLDEVTSQLDRATERDLAAALTRLQEGRTTIQIAHRMESVRAADRVAVIDGGTLCAFGTYDEVATNEIFRALTAREADSN